MWPELDTPRILKKALAAGGEYADLYLEDFRPTMILMEADKVDKYVSCQEIGAGLRVIANKRTAYAYTNSVHQADLEALAEAVASAVKGEVFDRDIAIKAVNAPNISPVTVEPQSMTAEGKVALCRRANETARKADPRVAQVRVVYREGLKKIIVINSEGDRAEEDKTHMVFLTQVVAMENGNIQTGYEPAGGYMGLELFDTSPPEKVAEEAARQAILNLGARPCPAGTMTVVLSSQAGGTMIHEAVGHGLEADLVQQGLSVYQGKVGQKIAADHITVIDDATMPNKRGSFNVDDEATPSRRKVLVENGVLKTYMFDRLSAMKMGGEHRSTGNGRRESYRHKPIVRMTNTYIAPGKESPEEILRSVDKGLYVVGMGGGQVNTINGDFVFEVTEGYLVENGRVGDPVRGATLTGNGPKVLMEIDKVGNDLGFCIGTCGKDEQAAPVTDAQPTLRIPQIVVGGAG